MSAIRPERRWGVRERLTDFPHRFAGFFASHAVKNLWPLALSHGSVLVVKNSSGGGVPANIKLNGGHNTHLGLVLQERSLRQIISLNLSFSGFHSCKELESGSVKLGLSWDKGRRDVLWDGDCLRDREFARLGNRRVVTITAGDNKAALTLAWFFILNPAGIPTKLLKSTMGVNPGSAYTSCIARWVLVLNRLQMSVDSRELATTDVQRGVSANASPSESFREEPKDGLAKTYCELDEFIKLPAYSGRCWSSVPSLECRAVLWNMSIVKRDVLWDGDCLRDREFARLGNRRVVTITAGDNKAALTLAWFFILNPAGIPTKLLK
ncbi:hypothetical protein BJ912DRAFT_924632 [Pholiota molesta]|nr:hypothetical protein BJ912DRAFT_924632 [Pholiota molesta]